MTNIDINYAVMGTKNSTKETGFIYIDRGCSDYSFSTEPTAVVTQTPNSKTMHYSISSCNNTIEFIRKNIPSQFSNLKTLCLETTYDFENMRIITKIYEVMDNNELVELGKECD